MELPDYKGGSIVNLMSSIAQGFGNKTKYKTLNILPPAELKDYKNIILIVIDGMGFEYLKKEGEKTIFSENLIGPMTSVFLPTTASAITTFLTGVAPQQHALTGWFMNLKEIGVVSKILPFSPRVGGKPFSNHNVMIDEIINQKSFSSKIKASKFVINHERITNSDFSNLMSIKARKKSYKTLNGFFRQIKKAINSNNRRKYIYAYWPGLDEHHHEHGTGNKKSKKHFLEIERKIKKFSKIIRGTNTILIITSDHGFVDTPLNRIIKLEDHPKLKECLTLPLCGEGRTAYCYVRPSKTKKFEKYVKTKLKKYCDLYKGQELIDKKYFGLFEPNPKLFDRIGDYVLVFKENYIIKDKVNKEKKKFNIGHHGGLSKEEMIVPLIIIKCKN